MKKNYIPFLLFFALLIIISLAHKKKKSLEELTTSVIQIKPAVVIPSSVKNYTNLLEQYLDSTNNVGAALAIVKDDNVLVMKGYGVKKAGTNDSVNKHTVFRLASCSKGFSGVLACLLEQDSVFRLQDKIITYLPGFRLKEDLNTNQLTIENTLSHTSGLVPHAFDNMIEDGVPLPLIINELAYVEISAPPGEVYGYQNVVFSLLDTITRITTRTHFDQLLESRIFRPLHMRDASANEEIFLDKDGNFAYPHAGHNRMFYSIPLNLGYYNISPAAGVNASISDLSKWLLALIGNNPKILNEAVLDKIETPVIISPLQRRYTRQWGKIDSKYYSLGWRIYEYRGRKIIYHGGYVKGYRAEIAFCPEEKIGIAFLQNSPNFIASLCVPTFYDMYFNELDSTVADSIRYKPFEGFEWFEDSSYHFNSY